MHYFFLHILSILEKRVHISSNKMTHSQQTQELGGGVQIERFTISAILEYSNYCITGLMVRPTRSEAFDEILNFSTNNCVLLYFFLYKKKTTSILIKTVCTNQVRN